MSDACDLLCLDLPKAEVVRAAQPDAEAAGRLAARAAALGDPTRLAVALALADAEELCGCDLAWVTGRSQGAVSHHVKALKHAGLARSRRDGKLVMHGLTPSGRALLDAVRATEEVAA